MVNQMHSNSLRKAQIRSDLGNKQLPSNLARRNKLEFNVNENDYENTDPKTYEEEKKVTMTS